MGVCVLAMGEGGVGMSVWECLGPWVKGFRGWVCVSIGGDGWNGLGVGVCVWAMGEGGVGMDVWECLGPWVKGFRGWMCVSIRGHGWNGLGMDICVWALAPLLPLPPTPYVCFVLFNGLNHDMNHNMWTTTIEPWQTTTKLHLSPGVVSVTGGSRRRECSVLENFAWLLASKMGRNCHSRTNLCITGNLPGCWLQKKCGNHRSRTNSCITGKLEIFLCNFG